MNPVSILAIGGIGAFFFWQMFFKKGILFVLYTLNKCHFYQFLMKTLFFKTRGTRLSSIIAPNQGLE